MFMMSSTKIVVEGKEFEVQNLKDSISRYGLMYVKPIKIVDEVLYLAGIKLARSSRSKVRPYVYLITCHPVQRGGSTYRIVNVRGFPIDILDKLLEYINEAREVLNF